MAFFKRLGKLQVDVAADTSGFTRGMGVVASTIDKVKGSLGSFTRFASSTASAVAGIAAKITGLGAAIAGGSFTFLTVQAFKSTAALSKLSRQLGVTVGDLARAKQASILAGNSSRFFDGQIRRLSSQLQGAGAKTVQFKGQIQDWVKELAKGGSEADRFGLVVDDSFARVVESAQIATRRVREAFVGRFRQIATGIAPFIEFAADKLTEFVTNGTFGLFNVENAMAFVRDKTADLLDLLQQMPKAWLSFKVAGLDALLAIGKELERPAVLMNDLRLDAIDFWSQIFVGKGNVKFTMREEFGGSLVFDELARTLAKARKELEDFAEPDVADSWGDTWKNAFNKIVDDAQKFAREMTAATEPPKLRDIKSLSGFQTRLAPSIEAGSVAAQQASFRAQAQTAGPEQLLGSLIAQGSRQATADGRRNDILANILRAAENAPVVQMSA